MARKPQLRANFAAESAYLSRLAQAVENDSTKRLTPQERETLLVKLTDLRMYLLTLDRPKQASA